jgi:hypothetical protein
MGHAFLKSTHQSQLGSVKRKMDLTDINGGHTKTTLNQRKENGWNEHKPTNKKRM